MTKLWRNICSRRPCGIGGFGYRGGTMAQAQSRDFRDRSIVAFQPVSDMLDSGACEPMKAAVHGVLMATVAVCAAYNTAAWIKRRQPHLAINAVVYTVA